MKKSALILTAFLMLASCTTTKYVPVEVVTTDTLVITRHERDSIYLKDSTNVHEWQRGDTVYVEVNRWRTEYRDRWRHDTIYQHRVDSVLIPCPVEVEVERKLTWWQKTKMRCGLLFMALLGMLGVAGIIRIKKKLGW